MFVAVTVSKERKAEWRGRQPDSRLAGGGWDAASTACPALGGERSVLTPICPGRWRPLSGLGSWGVRSLQGYQVGKFWQGLRNGEGEGAGLAQPSGGSDSG